MKLLSRIPYKNLEFLELFGLGILDLKLILFYKYKRFGQYQL